jgi:hypothetical protein
MENPLLQLPVNKHLIQIYKCHKNKANVSNFKYNHCCKTNNNYCIKKFLFKLYLLFCSELSAKQRLMQAKQIEMIKKKFT